MHTENRTDSRRWKADSVDSSSAWYYQVPDSTWKRLLDLAEGLGGEATPVTELRIPHPIRSSCAPALEPVLNALETGRGFAIIEGPDRKCSAQQLTALYWLVGQLLGRPFEQNVQGTLLYDVKDTGQDVRYGARFSVTNAESSFHTDNSFGTSVLDYVGLLCINTARSGGLSQVLSGHAVHTELLAHHREELETLYQPFHIDRRGGLRPGDAPTIQLPIIQRDGQDLLIRYLRYWIEAGHEKVGQPLTTEQVQALDVLDEVLARPEFRVEFHLQTGQMFFINNRWILHNRTAFEDHEEPERRRHYVRLWLQRA